MDATTSYEILGVPAGASLDDARSAYRRALGELNGDGAAAGRLTRAFELVQREHRGELSGTGLLGPVDLAGPDALPTSPMQRKPAAAAVDAPAAPAPVGVLGATDRPARPGDDGGPAPARHVPRAAAAKPQREARRSRRWLAVAAVLGVVLVAVVAYALATRGGGGSSTPDVTFARAGAPFSFRYPASLSPVRLREASTLNRPTYRVAIGLDPADLVVAATYRLAYRVRKDGSAVGRGGSVLPARALRRDVDSRMAALARSGRLVAAGSPHAARLGPLHARSYRFRSRDGTRDATFTLAFDGRTEYFLSCQSGAAHKGAIDHACSRVSSSFVPASS
jgi:hypothetical protein